MRADIAARAVRGPDLTFRSIGIAARVAEVADRHPDRVAVVAGARAVGYRSLCHRVDQFRAELFARGCDIGDRVAVVGPRCVDTIAVFLAIESIGAVYLPSDETRIAGAPKTVVTLGELDDDAPVAAIGPRTAPPDEPRYVIHTSGSTGVPKGTVVVHSGLTNHLWSMVERLSLRDTDVVAFSASPGYVVSIWQLVAALLVGGRIAVIDEADTVFGKRLVSAVAAAGVTVLELVPSVIEWLLAELRRRPRELPALRCLISTGEKLRPELAGDVLAALPSPALLNAYGAAECSDDVTLHAVTAQDVAAGRIPAGTPLPNVALHVLVPGDLRPALPGETGELWVGGAGVAAGYLDQPDATRAAFFADPGSPSGRIYRTGDLAVIENGLLYCVGRADRQVKIAGVRIELDGVEAVVNGIDGVSGCAVVVDGDALVAHVVAPAMSDVELLAAARAVLPPAMVPSRWVRLADLPLNTSGKVDYRGLAPLGS